MNSQLRNQILIGGLAGLLVAVLAWFLLGGKRDDLRSLEATNEALQKDVDKGYALKANYEKLKVEVAQQEKVIEELIKIMPTETDRGEIPYRVKKVADQAGVEQVSFKVESAIKRDYYTEYPFTFQFRSGFHNFGQFTSLVSGYEKIVNLSELSLKREPNRAAFPVAITCRISAFVYNPMDPKPEPPKKGARPAPAKAAAGEGD
jgi:type IV pilus assembly protein PilO